MTALSFELADAVECLESQTSAEKERLIEIEQQHAQAMDGAVKRTEEVWKRREATQRAHFDGTIAALQSEVSVQALEFGADRAQLAAEIVEETSAAALVQAEKIKQIHTACMMSEENALASH